MSVLVFSAHAIDYLWRAGGTIARYTKSGEDVHIVALTYGERGESPSLWTKYPNVTEEEIKLVRKKEAEDAAEVLGATIEFLDYGDNPMEITRERYMQLISILRRVKPRIVLTHTDRSATNPDHLDAGHHTLRAIRYAIQPGVEPQEGKIDRPHVFLFEHQQPESDGFQPQVFVDITDVMDIKIEAMGKILTQSALPAHYINRAEYRGLLARDTYGDKSIQYAEAFEMVTPIVGPFLP